MTDPTPPASPASPVPASITEALALLQATASRIEAGALRLERAMGNVAQPTGAPAPIAPTAVDAAADADLDSEWGNPQIKKDPPRWTGETYVGSRYSDCPPDYLLSLAGFLEWQASKADEKNELATNGKPRSAYQRRDAARARGWARRNASKTPGAGRPRPVAPPPEPVPGFDEADDPLPF